MSRKLAAGLEIPWDEAIAQTFAFLAKRGAGKTYAALKLAELMLAEGAQIAAVDPVGAWSSLRLAADGVAEGFDVPVFGGHRGDYPLEATAGRFAAELLVGERISAVLDVSLFTAGDHKRFATAFAERLLELKKAEREPDPLHLFLEESQLLVPQKPQRDEARMLGAFERLVKLGRNYGLGATLISQRPQAVNKDVLTQTETLVVLQTIGAHERRALRDWIREAGAEDREAIVDELPGLEPGEAYVWSPSWLRVFKRVRIAKRQTYDASATPKLGRRGKKRKPAATLSTLDPKLAGRLGQAMKETVERANANDPKHLRAEISRLTARAVKAERGGVNPKALEDYRENSRLAGERADAAERRIAEILERLGWHESRLRDAMKSGEALRAELEADLPARVRVPLEGARELDRPTPAPGRGKPTPTAPVGRLPKLVAEAPDPGLGSRASFNPAGNRGDARILRALAQYHPHGLRDGALATFASMKRSGGSWGTYLSRLRTAGYAEKRGEEWFATEAGVAIVGHDAPPAPTTTEEVLEIWSHRPGMRPAIRLVRILLERGPMAKRELAGCAGLEISGGSFGTYVSRARTAGLIKDEDGLLEASGACFP